MVRIVNTPMIKAQHIQLQESLDRIEKLVDLHKECGVRQTKNGLCYSIMSEATIAYKLTIEQALAHMEYVYIGNDIKIDVKQWQEKVQKMSRYFDSLEDEKHLSNTSIESLPTPTVNRYLRGLNPDTINIILKKERGISDAWEARKKRKEQGKKDDYNVYAGVENYGDRIAIDMFGNTVYKDYFSHKKKVEDYVDHSIFQQTKASILNKEPDYEKAEDEYNSAIEYFSSIENKATSRTLWKLQCALDTLWQARNALNIPEFMFEEFAIIRYDEILKKCEDIMKSINIEFFSFSHSFRYPEFKKRTKKRIEELSKDYDMELINSMIDIDEIENNVYGQEGLYVLSTYLKVNLEAVGRYSYSLYDKHTVDEIDEFLLIVLELTFRLQLLKISSRPEQKIIVPVSNEEQVLFLGDFIYERMRFKFNILEFRALVTSLSDYMKSEGIPNYAYIGVAIFAKYYGFLNQKLHATDIVALLKSKEYNISVGKNPNISPYLFLIKEITSKKKYDKIKELSLPKKHNPNTCTKEGLQNIDKAFQYMKKSSHNWIEKK